MLIENTLFGIEDKVKVALEMLRTFEPPEGYYVAYSGGKDSTVILDLIRRSGVKYDAHYHRTTVDPPELVRFIHCQSDVMEDHPGISMWDLIVSKKCPPTRRIKYCCEAFKEGHGHNRMVITGVRYKESLSRSKRRQVETCFKDSRKTFLHIIFHWSSNDVWEYIRGRKIPYCSLYDEGFKRLGCICCPQGGAKKQLIEAERWPKYKQNYLLAFERMLQARRDSGLETLGWDTPRDVWNWWTSPKQEKQNEEQMTIFN